MEQQSATVSGKQIEKQLAMEKNGIATKRAQPTAEQQTKNK